MWKFSCVMWLVFFTFGLDQHWPKRGWIGWDGYPHCSWHQSRPCTRFWMFKGGWRHCVQRTIHNWQQRLDLVFYSTFLIFRIRGLSYAVNRSFFLYNWPLMLILGIPNWDCWDFSVRGTLDGVKRAIWVHDKNEIKINFCLFSAIFLPYMKELIKLITTSSNNFLQVSILRYKTK